MKINKKNLSAVLVFSLVLFFCVCLNLHYSLAEENPTPVGIDEKGIINFAELGYQFDKISDIKIDGKLLPQTALIDDQCINLDAIGINYTDDKNEVLTFTYENETIELNITPDLISTYIYINKQNFPDEVFREYISENADTNKDGFLGKEEISNLKSIDFDGLSYIPSDLPGDKCKQIKSLKGINIFENLESLTLKNNVFKTLDLTGLTNIKNVSVTNNGISSVNGLNFCTNLETLNLSNNRLSNINLSKNTSLKTLNLENNSFNCLDLSNNASLKNLSVHNNQISTLDGLNSCTKVETLDLSNNKLSNIDLSDKTSLKTIFARSNKISNVWGLGSCTELETLDLDDNRLQCLDLSNNKSLKKVILGEQRIRSKEAIYDGYYTHEGLYYYISHFELDNNFDKGRVSNLVVENDRSAIDGIVPLISENKLYVDTAVKSSGVIWGTYKSYYDYTVPYGDRQQTSMRVIWYSYWFDNPYDIDIYASEFSIKHMEMGSKHRCM